MSWCYNCTRTARGNCVICEKSFCWHCDHTTDCRYCTICDKERIGAEAVKKYAATLAKKIIINTLTRDQILDHLKRQIDLEPWKEERIPFQMREGRLSPITKHLSEKDFLSLAEDYAPELLSIKAEDIIKDVNEYIQILLTQSYRADSKYIDSLVEIADTADKLKNKYEQSSTNYNIITKRVQILRDIIELLSEEIECFPLYFHSVIYNFPEITEENVKHILSTRVDLTREQIETAMKLFVEVLNKYKSKQVK